VIRGLSIIILILAATAAGWGETPGIRAVAINGPINPVTVEYLGAGLRESAHRQDRLFLIEMDTPGGLDAAMRAIVKEELASSVPVAVYVTPSGGRAASAGALIGIAADILAMAPGTNIGAAHPVAIGEKPDTAMQEKMVNDAEAYAEGIARQRGRNGEVVGRMVRQSISLPADKALASGVIDLVAADRTELLKLLDGRVVRRDKKEIVLHLAGARIVPLGMTWRQRVLNTISDPDVAYALMMIGMLGIFFELANPGVVLPGTVGGISLLLSLFAFQTLPVNYAGVLLILLALVLFIAEIKIASHGMLAVGGIVSMLFGSLLLFRSPEPYLRASLSVVLVTVFVTALAFFFVASKVVSVHRRKPVSGREGLVGEGGMAETDLDPEGKVFVRGEYWDALAEERIGRGERIEVVAVEGMRLKVKRR